MLQITIRPAVVWHCWVKHYSILQFWLHSEKGEHFFSTVIIKFLRKRNSLNSKCNIESQTSGVVCLLTCVLSLRTGRSSRRRSRTPPRTEPTWVLPHGLTTRPTHLLLLIGYFTPSGLVVYSYFLLVHILHS